MKRLAPLVLLAGVAHAGPDQPWREVAEGAGVLSLQSIVLALAFFAGLFWIVGRLERWLSRHRRRRP